MVSVNTNFGASIALQALNRTNRQLDAVQKRISTGYRVADAKDDGAAFAVAQGLRAQVKGNEAAAERLSAAKGLVSVTHESIKIVSELAGEMKNVLVKLSDENLSAAERSQYNADYSALYANTARVILNSGFNGVNMLLSAAVRNIPANGSGDMVSIRGIQLADALTNTLGAATTGTAAQCAAVIGAGGAMELFQGLVSVGIGRIGDSFRILEKQENFISIVSDAINFGLGAIVDADLAKESARLQSLQIRQQLGTQSLSLANQSPSALVSLFR